MKPVFNLTADDVNITDAIADRMISITSTDSAGFKSDTLSIKLDNRDYAIELPRKGALLKYALGYEGAGFTHIGIFTVDEISTASSASGRTLTIKAKAADMRKSLKRRKTRLWNDTTLGGIVEQIAKEHGLTPRISDQLADIDPAPIPYRQINQTNENDMHFLRRLALQYDAVAKPVSGYLVFVPMGEAKSVSGEDIAAQNIAEKNVSSWSVRAPDRGKYKSVQANWINPDTQLTQAVVAGAGEPTHVMRHIYADGETALSAANARLSALERGKSTITITMMGNASMAAEGGLIFTTDDPLARGAWSMTRVEHDLSKSGFITRIDGETPKEKK